MSKCQKNDEKETRCAQCSGLRCRGRKKKQTIGCFPELRGCRRCFFFFFLIFVDGHPGLLQAVEERDAEPRDGVHRRGRPGGGVGLQRGLGGAFWAGGGGVLEGFGEGLGVLGGGGVGDWEEGKWGGEGLG